MDGLTLLREARAAGLTVAADGARLCIRGPRQAEAVARRLLAHKAAVLAALAAPAEGEKDAAGWTFHRGRWCKPGCEDFVTPFDEEP